MDEPTEHVSTDCRSETGITVSLIDAIISICRVLSKRDLSQPEALSALKDLNGDEDMEFISAYRSRMGL